MIERERIYQTPKGKSPLEVLLQNYIIYYLCLFLRMSKGMVYTAFCAICPVKTTCQIDAQLKQLLDQRHKIRLRVTVLHVVFFNH